MKMILFFSLLIALSIINIITYFNQLQALKGLLYGIRIFLYRLLNPLLERIQLKELNLIIANHQYKN